jgi:gliding motility-associated-like protein
MANATGGTKPYKITWNNLKTTDTLYNLPVGNYSLDVEDENGCLSYKSIDIFSPDLLASISYSYTDTCDRGVGAAELIVNGGVIPYSYLWNNNNNNDDSSFVNNLLSGQNSCLIIDANSCSIISNLNIGNIISPEISFTIIPNQRRFYDQLDNPFIFFDISKVNGQVIDNWYWDFGDGNYGYDSLVTHSYGTMDTFMVSLVIHTEYNCLDTISKQVIVNDYQLFIPNAFTPNTNDDYNNDFKAIGYGISDYSMIIYNRWGEIIFESLDYEIGWNGLVNNGNKTAPIGIYVYKIQVINIFGEINNYVGQLKLLR